MAYLYASAVIDVHPWRPPLGPTSLILLADTATGHLAAGERFTLYLDWLPTEPRPSLRGASARRALEAVNSLTRAISQRVPRAQWTVTVTGAGRTATVAQFIPANEWHPAPGGAANTAVQVVCDASFAAATGSARAGVVIGDDSFTLDLVPAAPRTSDEAEFLALCLAVLSAASERSPLIVRTDSTTSAQQADLLPEGRVPKWVYQHGNDLAQRIVVAAMTALRLRPVTISKHGRQWVAQAHLAARVAAPAHHLMRAQTFARQQGIPLAWQDNKRGLAHFAYLPSPFGEAHDGAP